MYARLIDLINKSELLFQHHFAFKRRKSTEHATLDPSSSIIKGIKNHKKTACIFLDFAKGFNIGNHEILLKQFHHYGVRGMALEWIQSYITNRLKAVKLWQYLSEFQTTTC